MNKFIKTVITVVIILVIVSSHTLVKVMARQYVRELNDKDGIIVSQSRLINALEGDDVVELARAKRGLKYAEKDLPKYSPSDPGERELLLILGHEMALALIILSLGGYHKRFRKPNKGMSSPASAVRSSLTFCM